MSDQSDLPTGANTYTLADEWLLDLTPIAQRTLSEVFGSGDLDEDEIRRRLWRYVLEHARAEQMHNPHDRNDIDWMTPLVLDKLKADEDCDPAYQFETTETFERYSVNFDKVGSMRLSEVFENLQLSDTELFQKVREFIRSKELLRSI